MAVDDITERPVLQGTLPGTAKSAVEISDSCGIALIILSLVQFGGCARLLLKIVQALGHLLPDPRQALVNDASAGAGLSQ